jgi:RNA-directed DNA polymerase
VPVVASPTPVGVEKPEDLDAVRALQHALYRAAKADPGRRFHALYDKLFRRDVLQRAWEQVRRNRGAPGIDQVTIQQVEQYGVDRLLDKLAVVLEGGSYRPLAARRVWIPKPGSPSEQRPLSIPAVADRIVQAALKIVLEPIVEADMLDCSFGFRPRRAAQDALQVVSTSPGRGGGGGGDRHRRLLLGDSTLGVDVRGQTADLRPVRSWAPGVFLRAGVLEDGAVRRPVSGTPQGGVLSPCCATSICTGWTGCGVARTGRWWGTPMICWWSAGPVGRPRPRWRGLECCWPTWGCSPGGQDADRAPGRGCEGFDFLGFHHRLVRSRPVRGTSGLVYLARWPSRKAAQHARDRIRFLTMRARLAAPVEQIVQEVNAFLRGWVGLFRYGNSAREFDKIRTYAVLRVALFVAKRHQRGRAWGFAQVDRSPDSLGLISLNGIVIAPRPNRPWRAPVEHRR